MTRTELEELIRDEVRKAGRSPQHPMPGPPGGDSLGAQVTASAAFKRFVEARQRESDDIPVTLPLRKAGEVVATDYATPMALDRELRYPWPTARVREAFPLAPLSAPQLAYSAVTNISDNAAAVAELGEKPQTVLTAEPKLVKVVKVAVYAVLSREALDDVPGVQRFIDTALTNLLFNAEDRQLIAGSAPGELLGMAHVVGKQSQAFSTDVLETLRKAMTKLQLAFFTPSAVLLHPNNWEEAELLRDQNDRFMLYPADRTPRDRGGPQTLWGVPVIVSAAVPEDTAYCADFRAGATLHQYQTATIRLTDAHADFFTHNKVAVLAELREVVTWYQPKALVEVALS